MSKSTLGAASYWLVLGAFAAYFIVLVAEATDAHFCKADTACTILTTFYADANPEDIDDTITIANVDMFFGCDGATMVTGAIVTTDVVDNGNSFDITFSASDLTDVEECQLNLIDQTATKTFMDKSILITTFGDAGSRIPGIPTFAIPGDATAIDGNMVEVEGNDEVLKSLGIGFPLANLGTQSLSDIDSSGGTGDEIDLGTSGIVVTNNMVGAVLLLFDDGDTNNFQPCLIDATDATSHQISCKDDLTTAANANDDVVILGGIGTDVATIGDILDEACSTHTTNSTLGAICNDLEDGGRLDLLIDALATSGALATAQSDLDLLTGADGATLATSQGNYAPAKAADVATELATYDGPTNAEMEARTLVAASYFDPAADTVATVTSVTNDVTLGTDEVDADALKADAVDEIWAEVLTELSQGAPSATPSVRDAVMLLYMALRNELTVNDTAGCKTFSNDAGTVIFKKCFTDDGSIYTETEAETGP